MAKDGVKSDGDLSVATWRVALIFLLILVVDTAWEFFDEWVTNRIRRKRRKGLLHAWEQLKFEIMALGLVSLLLVVGEVRLKRKPFLFCYTQRR
jgi:hypothetical protein